MFAWNLESRFALHHLCCVERLIHSSWHHQGRNPGPQALRDGPNSSMMNHCRARRKYFGKGSEREVQHLFPPLWEGGVCGGIDDQRSCATGKDTFYTGLIISSKQGPFFGRDTASRHRDDRFVCVEKCLEYLWKLPVLRTVPEAKSRHLDILRPVVLTGAQEIPGD